jgi:hypothetical protein
MENLPDTPTATLTAEFCKARLSRFISTTKRGLVNFYDPSGPQFDDLSKKALKVFEGLTKEGCNPETAIEFMTLTLYDLVILIG